jgi:hypothetical protein
MADRLITRAKVDRYHFEALSWQARVRAAGGSLTQTRLDAVDKYFKLLDNFNLRSYVKRANLFIGANLAAALVPAIIDLGDPQDFNNGFVSADRATSLGLTGQTSSTKWLEPGMNRNQLPADSVHLLAYETAIYYPVAFEGMITSSTAMTLGVNIDNYYTRLNTASSLASADNILGVGPTISSIVGTRLALNKNGTVVFNTQTPTAGASSFYIFRRNTDETYGSSLGGYQIGLGLTDSQCNDMARIWVEVQRLASRPTPY